MQRITAPRCLHLWELWCGNILDSGRFMIYLMDSILILTNSWPAASSPLLWRIEMPYEQKTNNCQSIAQIPTHLGLNIMSRRKLYQLLLVCLYTAKGKLLFYCHGILRYRV